MKERRLWVLIAAPGLAVVSWLLILILLDGGRVGARSSDSTRYAADLQVSADRSYVCGGVWVSQTIDSAGDVGRSTSLALAPTYPYTPHIGYRKIIATQDYALKHAWLDADTWLSETVDSGGDLTSLALVPTYPYTPCVAYSDVASPNYWEWLLRYACRDRTTWTTKTLSSNQRAGQGGVSLVQEPIYPFTPHVSYNMPWGTDQTLYHSYLSGTTWMSGTWMYEKIEPALSEVGWWNSLALESSYPYTPHVSYYDYTNDDLRHAWVSGATWLTETVDSVGDVGWYTSLALDSSGNPHISYFDNTNLALKYAWSSGTAWLSNTVDVIGSPPWGSSTSLKLDQDDDPYICYYDATNDDLKLAYFNGAAWITQVVDSEGDVGAYCSLALDPLGCPHISYYDATNGDLKIATVQTPCSQPPTKPSSSQVYDLDHDAEDWGVYCEGSPVWNKRNVPSPSLDGKSLQCSIVGGAPYSNGHCYRNLLPEPTATVFTLTMSFWFSPTTTCNNQGQPSVIQALEFTMNKWQQDKRYEWALQWQNVGTDAPQWRYWDGQAWIPLSPALTQCLEANRWHVLALEGRIVGGQVHYERFAIDEDRYTLDLTVPPVSTPGESDRLAIAIQLDGNATQSPYDVFVDQVHFLREPSARIHLPVIRKGSSP